MPRTLTPNASVLDGAVCPTCYAILSRKTDLPRHMKTHAEDKDALMWHCTESGCGFKTLQRSNYESHFRTHTGEKNQKCPECPFAAVDPGSLTRHRKRIHGYQPPPRQGQSRFAERIITAFSYNHSSTNTASLSPKVEPVSYHPFPPSPPPIPPSRHTNDGDGENIISSVTVIHSPKDVTLANAISIWLHHIWLDLGDKGHLETTALPGTSHSAIATYKQSPRDSSSSTKFDYIWDLYLDGRYAGGVACPFRFMREPIEFQSGREHPPPQDICSINLHLVIWAITIAATSGMFYKELLHVVYHGAENEYFALRGERSGKRLVFGKNYDPFLLDE